MEPGESISDNNLDVFTDDDLLLYHRLDKAYMVMMINPWMFEQLAQAKEVIKRLDGYSLGPYDVIDFTVLSPRCLREVHKSMDESISKIWGPDWYLEVATEEDVNVTYEFETDDGTPGPVMGISKIPTEEEPAGCSSKHQDATGEVYQSVKKLSLSDQANQGSPGSSSMRLA